MSLFVDLFVEEFVCLLVGWLGSHIRLTLLFNENAGSNKNSNSSRKIRYNCLLLIGD